MGKLELAYFKNNYNSHFNENEFLKELNKKLGLNIKKIDSKYINTVFNILNFNPSYYFDIEIFKEIYQNLFSYLDSNRSSITSNNKIFEYYFMGHNSYFQICQLIKDLKDFSLPEDIKTRTLRLPIYTTMLESSFSNLIRSMLINYSNIEGKEYTGGRLNSYKEILLSKGYPLLSEILDVDIRNSINHGRVIFDKGPNDTIEFTFTKQNKECSKKILLYEFDNIINKTYDALSSFILALTLIFNDFEVYFGDIDNNNMFLDHYYNSLELSLPGINCRSISSTESDLQLNIDIDLELKYFTIEKVYELALCIAAISYDKYDNFKQYMIYFHNPHVLLCFVRFENNELKGIYSGDYDFIKLREKIITRKDFQYSQPYMEEAVFDNKYFTFPNLNQENYSVNSIYDASTENRKRFRANLYIGNETNKENILKCIKEAINWLRGLKNIPSQTNKIKHGNMLADSIYLRVLREDRRKNKEVSLDNKNFVCWVDYNFDGKTSLENGGLPPLLWTTLYHEDIENMHIAWREGKHLMRLKKNKIGRNDPCICGSGKKYKKCCGRSGGALNKKT